MKKFREIASKHTHKKTPPRKKILHNNKIKEIESFFEKKNPSVLSFATFNSLFKLRFWVDSSGKYSFLGFVHHLLTD